MQEPEDSRARHTEPGRESRHRLSDRVSDRDRRSERHERPRHRDYDRESEDHARHADAWEDRCTSLPPGLRITDSVEDEPFRALHNMWCVDHGCFRVSIAAHWIQCLCVATFRHHWDQPMVFLRLTG